MAVIDEVPGLKVEIVVNRDPVLEYKSNDEEAKSTRVTNYIEATSGAEFRLDYTFSNFTAKHGVCAFIKLDGKSAEGRFWSKSDLEGCLNGKSLPVNGARSFENGQYIERNFCFSEVHTGRDSYPMVHASKKLIFPIDDSDACEINKDSKKTLKKIGSIRVEFVWANEIGSREPSRSLGLSISNIGTVSEKALKGRSISHQAR